MNSARNKCLLREYIRKYLYNAQKINLYIGEFAHQSIMFIMDKDHNVS